MLNKSKVSFDFGFSFPYFCTKFQNNAERQTFDQVL